MHKYRLFFCCSILAVFFEHTPQSSSNDILFLRFCYIFLFSSHSSFSVSLKKCTTMLSNNSRECKCENEYLLFPLKMRKLKIYAYEFFLAPSASDCEFYAVFLFARSLCFVLHDARFHASKICTQVSCEMCLASAPSAASVYMSCTSADHQLYLASRRHCLPSSCEKKGKAAWAKKIYGFKRAKWDSLSRQHGAKMKTSWIRTRTNLAGASSAI